VGLPANTLLSEPSAPTAIKTANVESFQLDLTRKGRAPQTRDMNLVPPVRRAAVHCLLFATLCSDSRVITAGIPNARRPCRCPKILSGTHSADRDGNGRMFHPAPVPSQEDIEGVSQLRD
jgi:hypothetical protein